MIVHNVAVVLVSVLVFFVVYFQEFVEDYSDFTSKIADLDRRLASVICQAFDDSCGTLGILKVGDLEFLVCSRCLEQF